MSKASLVVPLILTVFESCLAPVYAQGGPSTVATTQSLSENIAAVASTWNKPGKILLIAGAPDAVYYSGSASGSEPVKSFLTQDLSMPEGVASAAGCTTVWCGNIDAVTPAKMTILSQDPRLLALPLSQLAASHPIDIFLGSLTKQQLIMLATKGIGMDGLSPDQTLTLPDRLYGRCQCFRRTVRCGGSAAVEAGRHTQRYQSWRF